MPLNVMIIDDDLSFKKLLILKLKSFIPALNVFSFDDLSSVRTTLNAPPQVPIDLVIIDEHLPDGRGVDLIAEGWFADMAVLSVSSDKAPEIPGAAVQAGATYFLNKSCISEPLFEPLVRGIIDRNNLQRELTAAKISFAKMDTVKTLVSTLRHEINNPLGAVLGAAYILRRNESASAEQKEAAELVESSGQRIKHVLQELCQAIELASVTKAQHRVFHIPGDAPWGDTQTSSAKKDDDE